MRKSCLSGCVIGVLFLTLSYFSVLPADFSAIKNPKPNIMEMEKHYVQLKKIKTIDAELGNELYLFMPYSITVCKSSNDVFIYDSLQAKIFKLDSEFKTVKTSFGRVGEGPGEFGGTGKGYPVLIQMGRDQNLYANDSRKRKIIVFDQNGKFIRDIKLRKPIFSKPLIDSSGDIYTITVKDKIITACDEKNSSLFTLPNLEENFNYLFSVPDPSFLTFASENMETELETALTLESRFLLYFPSSSTMVILKDKKVSTQFRLWPNDAFNYYKTALDEVKKKKGNTYLPLFSNLLIDEANDDLFFLQSERDEKRKVDSLYQFNDKGQLLKVFYVKVSEGSPPIHFKAKNNQWFYAKEDDKLTLYQEMK